MRMKTRIDVVSGFLGAGKTTLCNHLLQRMMQRGERPAYLVNEFGKTGIDAKLLAEQGFVSVPIEGGCICCTLKDSVAAAIESVIDIHHPTRILFEPSGVFIFDSFLELFQSGPLSQLCEIGGLITVVDSVNFQSARLVFGSFLYNQIQTAETLVLSKTETVPERVSDLLNILQDVNPTATILAKPFPALSDGDLLKMLSPRGEITTAHAVHRHERLATRTISLPDSWTRENLDAMIAAIQSGRFGEVYRAKGLIQIEKDALLVNIAGTDSSVEPFSGAADQRLTLIGKSIDQQALQAFLAANGS